MIDQGGLGEGTSDVDADAIGMSAQGVVPLETKDNMSKVPV
jgi:hypothetical protein